MLALDGNELDWMGLVFGRFWDPLPMGVLWLGEDPVPGGEVGVLMRVSLVVFLPFWLVFGDAMDDVAVAGFGRLALCGSNIWKTCVKAGRSSGFSTRHAPATSRRASTA